EDAPGWYRLKVRAGDQVLLEHTLNPRAAHGWRDFSVPLERLGRGARLGFEIRLTDRDGADVAWPPGLLLGVSDPTVHDVDDYGKAKGIVLVSIDTLRRDHVGAYGYAPPTTPRIDALAREGVFCEDAVSTSSWTLPAHLSMLTSVDPVANRALDVLDRIGDRPFFLFLHFYDPHWHYEPPENTRKIFDTSYAGTITGRLQDFSHRDRKSVSPADLAHLVALYDGEIRYVDDELGRVFDHVRARGLDRGTLVLVTSDHGEEFLEHGSWEHQKTLYEEVVRIPLLFRGPGVAPRRDSAETSLLDVAPTLLTWAGVPVPAPMQGRSLLARGADREAYGETDHTVDGTHKLFLRAGARRW